MVISVLTDASRRSQTWPPGRRPRTIWACRSAGTTCRRRHRCAAGSGWMPLRDGRRSRCPSAGWHSAFSRPRRSRCVPPRPHHLMSPVAGVTAGSRGSSGSQRAPGRDVVARRRCQAGPQHRGTCSVALRDELKIIFCQQWYQRQRPQAAIPMPQPRLTQEVSGLGRPATTDFVRAADSPAVHDLRGVRAPRRNLRLGQ